MTVAPQERVGVLRELLEERWSCRGFLDTPVPDEILTELLSMAQRSPSWCNTQPWQLTILRGDELESVRHDLVQYALAHEESPDLPFPARYAGEYQARRRECGWQLYESVGIVKGDRQASAAQGMENFRFFGAPTVAVVTTEHDLATYGAIDCGVYVGNFLLAAQSLGLATIAQASVASYSDFFRERLALPDNRKVIVGISFGYADRDHPTRNFRTSRAKIDEVVVFRS
jgi:nitroreductase